MKKELAERLLQKVKADYDFGGEFFSKVVNPWESIFNLVRKEVKDVKVLDIGCGDGKYLKALIDKEVEYIGVDNCEVLIREARRKFPDYNFQVADILYLPFDESKFDVVLCIATLHHIPSRKLQLKTLREMHRVLKPGGKLVMTNWDLNREAWNLKHIALWLYSSLAGKQDGFGFKDLLIPWGITENKIKRYYHAFSLAELKGLVKKAGFKVDKAYYLDRREKSSFWQAFWRRGNMVVVARK